MKLNQVTQWQSISTKSGSMLVKDSAVIEYKVTKSHVTVPHHLGSVLAITVGIREPTILRLEIARFWTNDGRTFSPYISSEAKRRVIRVVRALKEGEMGMPFRGSWWVHINGH